jgi:hypothetical protein
MVRKRDINTFLKSIEIFLIRKSVYHYINSYKGKKKKTTFFAQLHRETKEDLWHQVQVHPSHLSRHPTSKLGTL